MSRAWMLMSPKEAREILDREGVRLVRSGQGEAWTKEEVLGRACLGRLWIELRAPARAFHRTQLLVEAVRVVMAECVGSSAWSERWQETGIVPGEVRDGAEG